MTPEEQQFKFIALGEETKIFLSSDLGKHMLKRAEVEVERAKAEFLTTDIDNKKKLQELQNTARLYGSFIQWLDEAINDGEVAYRDYQSEGE